MCNVTPLNVLLDLKRKKKKSSSALPLSEAFFKIYDSSSVLEAAVAAARRSCVVPLEPKAAVRGLLYSVRVVIALSLTVCGWEGERAEQVDSQIVCYEMMVGG